MARGEGINLRGSGQGRGLGRKDQRGIASNFPFQKSTLWGTLFAFGGLLFGNWLDKKLSQKKSKSE